MGLEKYPRWALLSVASVGILAVGLVAADAKAKVEEAGHDAQAAKVLGVLNQQDILSMKDSLREIKTEQTNLSYKLDRNQEENQRVFRQVLSALKDQ